MDSSTINQWLGNGLSLGAIAATLMGLLPVAAALVALIWYLIQIYESATIQAWIAHRRTHKIAKLKARIEVMEADNND